MLTTDLDHNPGVALVLCGALAREVLAIVERHGWNARLFGIAARDHLVPSRITPHVEQRLRELIPQWKRVVVVYGDCGTTGQLDELLARYNVPRISGPHCYEMYAGAAFEALIDEQPGTFFLTDFLVRGWNGTLIKGLGLDRFPELTQLYFGNYTRLVYLMQQPDEHMLAQAREIAASLGLPLEFRHTGYGLLEQRLVMLMEEINDERYRPVLPATSEDPHDDVSDSLLARHPASGARAGRRRARERSPA